MNTDIRKLEPEALWNYFADLSAVPRPSGHEQKAAAFILEFGRRHKLDTIADKAGNVLIRKPATSGMENRKTVALQAHLDMVHQKNAETVFDFSRQGIEMYVEDGWVKACGTTLGADNGIGVAAIMAILASRHIPHPPLEALFTVGEEVGATGALGLKSNFLQADVLLNLDSEDDSQLIIGCAGSLDIVAKGSYVPGKMPKGLQGYRLAVRGLTGGHSGVDIHLGRGNASKILNHILSQATQTGTVFVSSFDGGNLRNAIPREAVAELAVSAADAPALRKLVEGLANDLRTRYSVTDPKLHINLEPIEMPASLIPPDFLKNLFSAIDACPHGVHSMHPLIDGLVGTSNNLARVLVKDGTFLFHCLSRSSSESEMWVQSRAVQNAWALTGARVTFEAATPAWQDDPGSSLCQLVSSVYIQTFKRTPEIRALHAGLECGIIGSKYPAMEMISFGPVIKDAHSPNERVQLSSVQKFWCLLLGILKEIPGRELLD